MPAHPYVQLLKILHMSLQTFAEAEQLDAHKNAMTVRIRAIEN